MRWLYRRSARAFLAAAVVALLTPSAWTSPRQGPDATVDNGATLLEAKRLYDATEYQGAVGVLDRIVTTVDSKVSQSPARLEQLAAAYELRARARYGLNNPDGARTDFKSLLTLDPGRTLPADVSPRVVAIFTEVKKTFVGVMNVTVAPADAAVQVDGVAVRGAGAVPILAGEHTVTARRAGYAPLTRSVSVAADGTADVALTLDRVSSVVSIVSVPADVEVFLDGTLRGRTESGAAAPESNPFVLSDLQPGAHTIALRRDCYVASEQRLQFQAADYRLPPIKLVKAVGVLSVTGRAGGAIVLDGQAKGTTPASIDDVCEGAHVLEVRSPIGRYVRRFDIKVGERVEADAEPRPAIALLSVTGLPDGLRGGPDLRLLTEDTFRALKTATVFAAPVAQIDEVLLREGLRAGWLSFDTTRRPVGDVAANITAAARQELSARLTRTLDVQAVAALTVPSRDDPSDVFLTMLAAKSGQPDTLRIKLDAPESVSRAVEALDSMPSLFRLSADMQVADILDVAGAVVVGVTPAGVSAKAGVTAGDVIVSANGRAVVDASAFLRMIDVAKVDELLSLELRDRKGASKHAEFRLVNLPQVVAMVDRTLLSNKLLLDFRRMLDMPSTPLEESVARLNLGVALMRVGNWVEARTELEKVQLPDGAGVSNGTALYLLGLCRAALGQTAEAESAFRRAADSKDSLLTADGPPIKALADAELSDATRRPRGPFDR